MSREPQYSFAERMMNTGEDALGHALHMSGKDGYEAYQAMRQDRVLAAVKEVARLSRLPARLYTSRAKKVEAMQELMLAQEYLHAYSQAEYFLKTIPKDDPNAPALQPSAETIPLPVNIALIYDEFKIKDLFTKKELESPEVKELTDIIEQAKQQHTAQIDLREKTKAAPITHNYKSNVGPKRPPPAPPLKSGESLEIPVRPGRKPK